MNDIRNRVIELDINDVLPNRFQPRVKFNEEAIIELSESIREHGIIQPIIVRPIGDKYEIIAGERRYKASILAGKESIPAIITDLNDKESAEIALIENVQRKNLTPIEEAVSYKKILDMGYLTQEQLALKLGRSQSSIANKMRLLHLSDEVQEALIEEKISERHARSLLKLNTSEKQNQMLERIITERLTVRKTDEEIEKMNQGISQVEEPQSFVNTNAFVNSNPGFVDVNKIENQAQEIKQETPKVDINALLRPDASRPTSTPTDTSKPSSIFSFFAKEKKEEEKPEEIRISNRPNLDITDNEQEKEEPIYTFQPLPVDSSEEENDVKLEEFKPIKLDELKPMENNFDVVEPVMPSIDLSSFKPTPSISLEPEVKPTTPEIKTPEPVVQPEKVSNNMFADIVFDDQGYVIKAEPARVSTPVIEPVKPIVPEPVIEKPSIQESIVQTPTVQEPVVKPAEIKPTPIIITDYDKQYDPIMPNQVSAPVAKVDFKEIISSIRETSDRIEKAGYEVDTDEIDLGTEYRVIITIKKEN